MTYSTLDGFTIAGYLAVIPAICIFGIVGNILTLLVLIKGHFQSVAFMYLKGLAVYDMLGLLFILPICIVRCPICNLSGDFWTVYIAYLYIPIGDIFLKASILTTVTLTIERCIVIRFSKLCHLRTRRTGIALIVMITIGMVCTFENLPTFWQLYIADDGTVKVTEYGKSTAFLVYGWADAVCFQFLPMTILFIFNIVLVLYLRTHRKQQKCLEDENQLLEQRFQLEQTRIIFMLVGIIVLFLVTMVPSSIMQLIGYNLVYHSQVYLIMRLVSTTLTSLNFACNFLLYCTLNKRFWKTFKRIIGCCGNKVYPEVEADSPKIDKQPANQTSTNRLKDGTENRPISGLVLQNTEIQPDQEKISEVTA